MRRILLHQLEASSYRVGLELIDLVEMEQDYQTTREQTSYFPLRTRWLYQQTDTLFVT